MSQDFFTRYVTYKEFVIYHNDFNEFDLDGNGALSFDEIKGLLNHQLGRDPTEEEANTFFAEADLDHDGRLCLNEYLVSLLGSEWEFDRASLPPPAPLWQPNEEEEEDQEQEEELIVISTQKEINTQRNLPCGEEVLKVMAEIIELNPHLASTAEGSKKIDEPSVTKEGKLKSWQLGSHGLEALPASFGRLKFEGNLILCQNHLKSLPDTFGNLQVAGLLDLDFNPLTSLPASIGSLKVGSLSLSHCKLAKLPESFSNMEIHGDLALQGNPLRPVGVPSSFRDLRPEGTVLLDTNQIKRLKAKQLLDGLPVSEQVLS